MKSEILQLQKRFQLESFDFGNYLELLQKKLKVHQDKCNSFVTLLNPTLKREGVLSGVPYALKDNFSTKGILTTASSNTLKNYIPVYNATVYEKLLESGALLVGKTTMDEFGMGATGTTGHTGVVTNPFDETRQAGGSSAGSAAVVASGILPFALGSDTGDSVRKPAAYCGIVGYKPTYGLISRYGMFPFASSLDHVGVLTRTVKDAAIVVDQIKGQDPKDMTSIDSSQIHLQKRLENKENKHKKLFYLKEIMDIDRYENPSEDLKETFALFEKTLVKAKELGWSVQSESIDVTLLEALASSYMCISCAEATSNLSNLTGIIFGLRGKSNQINEMIKESRTDGFSPLIKRRLVIGSYVLQKENQEKYFKNAMRVRKLIVDRMNELFQTYDALILPCGEGRAKLLDGSKNSFSKEVAVLENHMVIGNFGGFPSITIPNGYIKGLPVGINLTGAVRDDENLLEIADSLEEKIDFQLFGGEK
ncbi:MAG: Asp-tRNA(Asn)/Glu-tRNA(Gln) amidotransferase subunit GatA [Bacilli bacterium]|jgi:aspartyl-tRNA(Asn)/glutamyl-tRNA(Gln) amidotransferase subunit A|nr:Asp-tRNA(Asn)/Glu-tRNA(Gln) amidotransferase subunit GatA [Bacilli bacterium]